jgi:Mrp family chromosome partitioning ATPase
VTPKVLHYIIFDVPPVLTGADALAFASLVDSILMVVEAGKTSINDVNTAISLLPRERILGVVLTERKIPTRFTSPVPLFLSAQNPW